VQKGPQLLAEILYDIVHDYWDQGLQVVSVANGDYQGQLHDIVTHHDFHERVAVCDFDEALSHLAYAASDFMLMPSRFEPCGLPQMISCTYGSLPLVHNTGGLRDTVEPLNVGAKLGKGFVFEIHDAAGLRWAVDQAMAFYCMPPAIKEEQIRRVMTESKQQFNHSVTACYYFDIYERMLQRPIIRTL